MNTMTPAAAKRLAIAAVVVSGVLASIDDISKGELPDVRIALGMGVAGVLLLLLADAAPPVAGGLAGLLLLSAVLNTGGAAFARIQKGLGK